MKRSSLLALPPAVLLCASSCAAEPQWPYNLPKHIRYLTEEEAHVKRNLEIRERLRREKPIGVKKMSVDEGEMFFLDNWIFASDIQSAEKRSEPDDFANITAQFVSPLRPHSETTLDSLQRFRARSALMKRDFKCPDDTHDCSTIDAPNSCCSDGSFCISIEDTGFGSVGCCAKGSFCAGEISCDADNGYSSCPNSQNGGCCLPGYSCQDVGCVVAGTSVTYVQPSTSTTSSSTSSTAVIVVPTTASPSTTTTTAATSGCNTGSFSCPASLGGGCCQSGLQCATGAACLGSGTSASTESPSAPVRPTGETMTTATSTISDDICPSGFYVCSAYYPSGCCRVGRDCQTTGSCVPITSATIVNSNGMTIVAPSGASTATAGVATQGGSCPSAWYSCPADRGGNCCPEGYSCGEQCTATSGTGVSLKVAPSVATIPSTVSVWALISGAVAVGIAMIAL
ncbi:hypothetical protein K458DRAFT_320047 [Lentithecium fluviatile CBS 122367]|uniref:GPI anchored protein n=1 Tax=Lentithecium fluviatile CBS 122367 TaxID=1168545 RepID=A0A6G1IH46_9PLEO|nr:hypothetical protein K458DRAFT_320047 [Lentithecium fluviatile CBS 122367]